jgi:uncharacterized protein YbdZ (MbtH family)
MKRKVLSICVRNSAHSREVRDAIKAKIEDWWADVRPARLL